MRKYFPVGSVQDVHCGVSSAFLFDIFDTIFMIFFIGMNR